MTPQINLSKVLLPKRRIDLLRRVRLLDKLHQNIDRKLTYISAPAGYGKTSLVLDLADDVDFPVCWYHITRGDEDLTQFASYIVASFQQQFPDFGHSITHLLQSPGTPDPHSLTIEITNEIITKIDDFCILVLDDYHIVGEKLPVVDFVEIFLDHLPDNLRFIIASRNEFGIPAAKLYIWNELSTISEDDLRFRAIEIQNLIKQNFHKAISSAQAEDLAKRSDGWIVAILLAIRSLNYGLTPPFSGSTADKLYGFLAKEVIQKEKKAIRNFMLTTSIVDEFNESLVDYLLGNSSSNTMIREVEKRNLFITRIETSEGSNYRYHQLFLDFLRNQFSKEAPDRVVELHRRAADWFMTRKSWELAVHHKLASGDRIEAAKWMDQVAKHIFITGQKNILDRWVNALSRDPDIRTHAPELLLNWAKILIDQGNFEEAERILDIIEPIFRAMNNSDQLINLIIARSTIWQAQRKFNEALEIIEIAQNLLQSNGK